MNKMKVYHLSCSYLGDKVMFKPREPGDFVALGEDETTPRICVCPHVYGCFLAIAPQYFRTFSNSFFNPPSPIFLYSTIVPIEYLYQPSCKQVPDAFITGELWILKPQLFTLEKRLAIRKHMDIGDSPYSRFAVHPEDEDEIIDKLADSIVYFESEYNFSYLALDCNKVTNYLNTHALP